MDRIWHFLAERSVDLADRVETAIRTRVERLVEFPHFGEARPRLGIRELLLHDLQYRIGYQERDGAIVIVTLRSTKERA